MVLLLLQLFAFLGSSTMASSDAEYSCPTTQYFKRGAEDAVIKCHLPLDYYSINWYAISVSQKRVQLFSRQIGEPDYQSEDFNITSNGSLRIKVVTVDHEHEYEVLIISTDDTEVLVFKINVTVYEQPRQKYPVVDLCKGKINCIVTVRHKTLMSCSVEDVRPASFVGWFNKTGSSETLLNSSRNTTSNGETFSSFAKINITVTRNRFYELLVCQSFNQAPSINNDTAMVLLEPQHQPWISNKSEYGLLTKRTVLGCSISKQTVLIWKRRTEGRKYETIAYRMYNHSFESDASYRLSTDGSLIISSLSLENEGNYVCIYGTSEEQSYSVITLHAIVLSSINILGCNSSVQCVLEVQNGDHIECSLKGVRPEVNLEFVCPDSSTPSPITLEGQPRIPENHGDVYDISIKSRVKINADADIRNITIVCRVTNSAIGEHLMEAKAILTLEGLSVAGQDSSKSATSHTVLLLLVIFPPVALVASFVCFLACKRRKTGVSNQHVKLELIQATRNDEKSPVATEIGNLEQPHDVLTLGAKIIVLLNNKIKSFKWNGDLVEEYTDESGKFRPFAGAVFEEKLYVTDKTSKCILVFSTSLDYERNFGQDHLNRPRGITVCEEKGLLLVLNGGGEADAVISVFKPNGEYVIEIGQIQLEDPWYIKCNGTDEIFISDNGSREVTVFNIVDNKLVNRFSSDQADGKPMYCRGIDVDQDNNIYLAVRAPGYRAQRECIVKYNANFDPIQRIIESDPPHEWFRKIWQVLPFGLGRHVDSILEDIISLFHLNASKTLDFARGMHIVKRFNEEYLMVVDSNNKRVKIINLHE